MAKHVSWQEGPRKDNKRVYKLWGKGDITEGSFFHERTGSRRAGFGGGRKEGTLELKLEEEMRTEVGFFKMGENCS